MQHPRLQFSRWLLELKDFEFTVNYDPVDGTLLMVLDALSRYSFDSSAALCTRFREVVRAIEVNSWGAGVMTAAQIGE